MNFNFPRLSILFSLFLTACQSIGTQYVPPVDTQDSALLVGSRFFINQFDEEGCYSGRTMVSKDIRVHAEKEIFLAITINFWSELLSKELFCTVSFSFVPKKDEKYKVQSNISDLSCFGKGEVKKINDDGSLSHVPVTSLRPTQKRLACIKMVPFQRTNQ
jgi:hypothetical protein